MKSRFCVTALAVASAAILTACGALGGGSSSNSNSNGQGSGGSGGGSLQSVKHVIVMVQENRSFDHYFGRLNVYRQSQGLGADVDGLPAGAYNIGYDGLTRISAFHLATECTEDLSSFWNESHLDFNLHNPNSDTATWMALPMKRASSRSMRTT